MKYNPKIHHRRSIRLKGYDYSRAGLYFITICCQDMKCRFGKIEKDEMVLNELGMIAQNEWAKLPERFSNFELDVFQIMPNHIHGIILLNDCVVRAGFTPAHLPDHIHEGQPQGIAPTQSIINNDSIVRAGFTPAHLPDHIHEGQPQGIAPTQNHDPIQNPAGMNPVPTIGDIVGSYKSLVSNECLKIYKSNNEIMGKLLQRDYYEHIIRNESSYKRISEYIINNPQQWDNDKFYVGAGFTPAHL